MQWKHFGPNEATWAMEDQMWAIYPCFPFEAKQFDMVVWYFLYDGLVLALWWLIYGS